MSVKTINKLIAINFDDNDDLFPDTRAFAFNRQPMKRNFTWSLKYWSNYWIHLRSSSTFLLHLKFWFAKKKKKKKKKKNWRWTCFANKLLQITETRQKFLLFSKDDAIVQSYLNHVAHIIDQHFAEKSRQAQLVIIFQLEIIRD